MSSPRLGVKALIVRDAHVLMNHYIDPDGSDVYAPPGGGQEHGEDQVSALIRECREEIGALVEVHQLACLYELLIPPFHQVSVAYWAGLAEGEEPGIGTEPDPGQVGTAWLPLDRLAEYRFHPVELARWLESDPSSRPVSLGVCAA
ncbi:NUDIX domain-containing protein [Brachybacterium sp. GCM10030252]|uniref:NUDIX domain-containing protein n=1 Tax=Brachybacterium sp. GCM10030252 TaxID=3273380 RepID=UPI0036145501